MSLLGDSGLAQQIGNMGGIAACLNLRLEQRAGRLPEAKALILLDRDADTNANADADAGAMTGTQRILAGALLFGLLCGLKPLHAIAAAPLLAWAAWRHRRARWRPLAIALAVLVVLAVGGSSYASSWHATGNPVQILFQA